MLVDPDLRQNLDPLAQSFVEKMIGQQTPYRRVQTGVYLCPHWNFPLHVRGICHPCTRFQYPLAPGYGVGDSIEQVLGRYQSRWEKDPDSLFVEFTPVDKASQPPIGGFRWAPWGPYVGNHHPSTEYLYDDPKIEQVVRFVVYRYILE